MKNLLKKIALVFFCIFVVVSCDMVSGGSGGNSNPSRPSSPSNPSNPDSSPSNPSDDNPSVPGSAFDWTGETKKLASSDFAGGKYQLPSNVKTLEIPVKSGDILSMMKRSTSGVSKEQTQIIGTSVRAAEDSPEQMPFDFMADRFMRYDYVPAQTIYEEPETTSASIRAGETPVTPIDPKIGITTKTISTDIGKKEATLRAVGNDCYVWIVDDYFTTGNSEGAKVNATVAENLAKNFNIIYPNVRRVFGEESDLIGGQPIENVSDTGKKVNIVVFDIEGDYKPGMTGGTYGYFTSADYSPSSSNKGKYFYVDSFFAHATEESEKDMYSTLAHEFQHMVNYNQKLVKNSKRSATWYNEMLSMLAEDMLKGRINAPKTMDIRLTSFCSAYYITGVKEWLSGNNVLASYAMAYMFGSFLTRNYGGAELVHEMSTHAYINEESVVQAVNKLNSTTKTFDELFNEFTEAIALKDSAFSLKKSVSKTVGGEAYTFNAIDIHNWKWKVSSGEEHTGPGYVKRGVQAAIRPYGFVLHAIGKAGKDQTVSLTFSKPNSAESVFILYE